MKASVPPEHLLTGRRRFVTLHSLRSSTVACLVLFLCQGSLAQQAPGTRIETFVFPPNGSVRIENQRGASRVEAWNGNSVRVVAEKKQPPGAPLLPSDLVLMSAGGNLLIKCKQNGAPDRIDIAVYVPRSCHLQITGGAWPVEVAGSLASAVVDTTTGDIGYKLPSTDDVRVAMHSTRGVVRSALSLNVSDRSAPHGLQGSLGNGIAPIILNSQAGNITLLPSQGVTARGPVVDENRIRSLGMDESDDGGSRDRDSQREEVASQRGTAAGADRDYPTGAYQQSTSPSADYNQNASGAAPPSARNSRSYSPPASGGGSAVFAGSTN